MVDQPGMSFGNKTPQQWAQEVPQDQIVQLTTSLLQRIEANTTLKEQFTQQVTTNPTIARMLTDHVR